MRVPGGRVTRILWRFSSPVASTIRFRCEAVGGGTLSGDVVVKTRSLGRRDEKHFPLRHDNVVEKAARETDLSIFLRPDRDCEVTLERGQRRWEFAFMALGFAVMVAALVATAFFSLFSG